MGVIEFLTKACREPERTFLLIGGHAVSAHGFSRFTRDLDFLTSKSQRNYWKDIMLANDYTVYHEADGFIQFISKALEKAPVDFMLVNDNTFEKLNTDTILQVVNGIPVKAPSLMNLIALKLHVAKQDVERRSGKDLYDIVRLVKINKVDVRSEQFKQWCERFGNLKLYETIVKESK